MTNSNVLPPQCFNSDITKSENCGLKHLFGHDSKAPSASGLSVSCAKWHCAPVQLRVYESNPDSMSYPVCLVCYATASLLLILYTTSCHGNLPDGTKSLLGGRPTNWLLLLLLWGTSVGTGICLLNTEQTHLTAQTEIKSPAAHKITKITVHHAEVWLHHN